MITTYKSNLSVSEMRIKALCILLAMIALCVISGSARAQISNEQCYKCHDDSSIATKRPESLLGMVRLPKDQKPVLRSKDDMKGLYTDRETFLGSVHGDMQCVDCHITVETLPHSQRLPLLRCEECHFEANDAINRGSHRNTAIDGLVRPKCTDCHGNSHDIISYNKPRSYDDSVRLVETCERCHHETAKGEFDPSQSYRDNIHGKGLFEDGLSMAPTCVDCHEYHRVLPADSPMSAVNSLVVPETCGKCHQGVKREYLKSIHGQLLLAGEVDEATCTSCHHSHGVMKVDDPFLLSIVKECSNCHSKLGKSYLQSYHGKAAHLGYSKVAVCSSCHGSHDILPASDPNSRVAPQNLEATCGKCHKNANANFVKYIAHVNYMDRKQNAAVFFTFVGMTTLLLSVLALFIPHTFLWFQREFVGKIAGNGKQKYGGHLSGKQKSKLQAENELKRKKRMVQRFHPVHRFTHFLIVVSFMGLVLTGFPLKYSTTSGAQWAQDLANAFGGIHVMGILHRIFALITFAYAGVHVAFLGYFFWKKCPAPRWRYLIGPDSMIFSLRDFKDFLAMLKWFFWRGPRPKFDRWTYFEKFDYWGEIWGVFVIGGSGLMLWFPMLFTRWLPGWVLNCAMVVHSIEALLAASVIFLVHFFNTHLRPDKFPVDLVMFTGQMSEEEMEHERKDELDRLVAEDRLEERLEEPMHRTWKIIGAFAGIAAFMFGLFLIYLALSTEIKQFF